MKRCEHCTAESCDSRCSGSSLGVVVQLLLGLVLLLQLLARALGQLLAFLVVRGNALCVQLAVLFPALEHLRGRNAALRQLGSLLLSPLLRLLLLLALLRSLHLLLTLLLALQLFAVNELHNRPGLLVLQAHANVRQSNIAHAVALGQQSRVLHLARETADDLSRLCKRLQLRHDNVLQRLRGAAQRKANVSGVGQNSHGVQNLGDVRRHLLQQHAVRRALLRLRVAQIDVGGCHQLLQGKEGGHRVHVVREGGVDGVLGLAQVAVERHLGLGRQRVVVAKAAVAQVGAAPVAVAADQAAGRVVAVPAARNKGLHAVADSHPARVCVCVVVGVCLSQSRAGRSSSNGTRARVVRVLGRVRVACQRREGVAAVLAVLVAVRAEVGIAEDGVLQVHVVADIAGDVLNVAFVVEAEGRAVVERVELVEEGVADG
eukprot:m.171367 g.171367  ORF g.171367 m.171367 type:complete len:431 (+) comp17269_c0_seq5:80-1372(+)